MSLIIHLLNSKMIVLAILFFVTLDLHPVFGQSTVIDSLTQRLSGLKDDTSKVSTLLELSGAIRRLDSKKGESYTREALEKSSAMNYHSGMADSYIHLAWYSDYKGQYDQAQDHYARALDIYVSIRDLRGKARALIGIGLVYESSGNYEKAVEYGIQALEVAETIGGKQLMARACLNLGNLFRVEDEFNKALEYYQKAMKIQQSAQNELEMAGALNNIGLIYGEFGQYDSAIITFHEVLRISEKFENKYGQALANNNIGKDYRNLAKYDSASRYLSRAYNLQLELNDRHGQALSLSNLAETYLLKNEYDTALNYANAGYEMALKLNNKRRLSRLTKILYKIYEATDNFEGAFDFCKLHKIYEDSLFDNKKSKDIAALELAYGTEKKERQIAELEHGQELSELRRNILIGSTVAIIIVAFLLYNQQRLKSKKDRMLLEKEREVDRMKSRFFTNISHEFRTPLTLILGPLDEIRQNVTDKKSKKYLGMIRKNTGKLLNQVNQLLDLSRLDAGQLNLAVAKMDIVNFAKGITASFESLAVTRKIELSFKSESTSINVYSDKDCIEKILVNLISNALKFTGAGGKVEVSLKQYEKPMVKSSSGLVELIVSDTGEGIDEDQRRHIFERYYHTESDLQASTGIGLALVKELVERHSGTIGVLSTKGVGTTFTVVLPLGKAHWCINDIIEENADNKECTDSQAHGIVEDLDFQANEQPDVAGEDTILIIEDNEEVRLFVKEILKDKFKILHATNGQEGIDLAQDAIPDLIIMDVMMPGINGYEATKILKQSEKTSHIPVIILTAKADQKSKLTGLETEADDFITKPFEKIELLTRITNLINLRKKLRQRFSKEIILKPEEIDVTSVDEIFLERVMAAVEENIDNDAFGVEALGKMVGMSRSQINRKLQAITGHPPNRFIRNARLGRAMQLLKGNGGTVAEIAYMTGFSSPNYFSKCFSDQFGYPPGDVRKQIS